MRSADVTRWLYAALAATGLTAASPSESSDAAATRGCNKGRTNKLLTVPTSNGAVTGHIATETSCVLEYLGIPYAKPPVGELRFAAPQPIDRQSPYTAANFGFDCPLTPSKPVDYPGFTPQAQRIIDYFASGSGNPQDEDCLTLNIWSKVTAKATVAKKPVLVFFYGGRFTTGNTNSPFFDGKRLADAQDLVVVTVNYRTNIFGFPGAPGEPQNLGLRDQRAAVEWVRDNIAHFGGDVTRITLSGQSAGGVAADYWAYAYEHDPIAAGLILVSGNAFSFPVNAPGVPERNWNAVVAAVGCNTTTTPTPETQAATMTCMRAAPWTALKSAAASVPPARSTTPLRSIPPFYPHPDNTLIFPNYTALTSTGRFARLPTLLSTTTNEAGWYSIGAYRSTGAIPTAEQIAAFHLESFTCPASYQASARRKWGVPAWVYRYAADWENTRLYDGSGAYHGVDLHMVFGGAEAVSGLGMTREQREMVGVVQRAWAAFVGDPWEGLGRDMEVGWPMWEERRESLVELGVGNEAGARFVDPRVYDGGCGGVRMGGLGTAA
ncbi:cholinesterase [Parachaetomium inaequale]|uniref:Carboxylic ester hydrolase n=1 Tax=Parachaetomium inaequale TaxID=2588326 RepID=A0AAN6SU09_9PEZI|nr:cholinesterase [Parachaetomium inaequale]